MGRKVEIGFSAGNIIWYLAQDYGTIPEVIDQFVQNLLDAKASEAIIFVNLKSKSIEAYDNGKGASEKEFEKNVKKIGKSSKGEGDVGEKGVGKLASIGIMGKGGEYKLTTRPKSRSRATHPFFTATLKYDHLRDNDQVNFNFQPHPPNFSFKGHKTPDGRDVSRYTTRVRTTCIEATALSQISKDPDALKNICEEIGGQYAAKLKKLNTKISVAILGGKSDGIMEVRPQEFRGRREDPVTIETKSGPVRFEMWTTTKKEPKPRISVRHQGVYDLSLRGIQDVWNDHREVFGSGYIQGYIHLNFCETNTKRTNFVWSDERQDFMEAVEDFVTNYAAALIKDLKKEQRLYRIQESMQNAMAILDKFIRDNPGVLSDSLRGAISTGHSPKKGKKTEEKLLGPRRRRKSGGPPISVVPKLSGKEKKGMKHNSAQSRKGRKRTVVKGESGLLILHSEPDPLEEDINWTYRLKLDEGSILINISHKLFKIHSDKSVASMDAYILELTRAALTEAKIIDERGPIAAEGWRQYYESYHVRHVDVTIK